MWKSPGPWPGLSHLSLWFRADYSAESQTSTKLSEPVGLAT